MSNNTEIVTPAEALAADLAPLAETINAQADLIHRHELATQEETILPRLLIGQSVARAKELFGITDRRLLNAEGKNQHTKEVKPQRGTTSDTDPIVLSLGFQSWLRKASPKLARQTAEKYAKAFNCLDLPHDCKPAQITAAVKNIRHKCLESGKPALSLAYIIKDAEPEKQTTLILPPTGDSATLRLHDAREFFHNWKETFEKLLKQGCLDDLEKKDLLDLKEFAAGIRDRINARLK